MSRQHLARRACQLAVIALFIALPLLNQHGWHYIQGTLFAFNLWKVPFADPASAAQVLASGQWPIWSYLGGAALSLVIAFFLGRIFCGWLCPYGLFSEVLHGIRVKNNKIMPREERKWLWYSKCFLLIIGLPAGAVLAWPVITSLSMPGQLSLVPLTCLYGMEGALFSLALIPAAALLAETISGRRLWCQYICPQSVLLGLAGRMLPQKMPGLRISWNASACDCGKAAPCARACTMNLNPRHKNGPPRRDCTMCGDCVEACKQCGKSLTYTTTV